MKLGVIFPQTEIGIDPIVIRNYAQAVEGAGYDHLSTFDHVLGAQSPIDRAGSPARTRTRRCSTSRWCCSATSPRSRSASSW